MHTSLLQTVRLRQHVLPSFDACLEKVGTRQTGKSRARLMLIFLNLCIGMSAGVVRVAAMVEARSNSTRADRPHHLLDASAHISRSFLQAVTLMEKDVDVYNRDYISTVGAHSPRPVSGGMRIARLRIHEAWMCATPWDPSTGRAF